MIKKNIYGMKQLKTGLIQVSITIKKENKMKKLTVVGKGAVGSLAVAHFLHYTDWLIEWIYDENIPTASVGEATNLTVPLNLYWTLDFRNDDLLKINGTAKLGISKKRWGKQDYFHFFPSGMSAMHFTAKELQDSIFNKVKNNSRLVIKKGHVENPETLDSDFVLMCVGSPKETNKQEFEILKNIPVNSAYVTQCNWDYAKFQYSLTDAMKHGWVFGIPLQNRIAIGYMYNDTLASLDEVKQDVQQVFSDYNLIPSNKTTELHFESYYRKQNFTPKVVYNGNASFFLEPLEATSTGLAVHVMRIAWDLWNGNLTVEQCQKQYEKEIDEIESMILLHYMAGSTYKSKFWKKAKKLAISKIKKEFETKTEWAKFVLDSTIDMYDKTSDLELGTWGYKNYQINIKGLGLEKEIKKLGGLL